MFEPDLSVEPAPLMARELSEIASRPHDYRPEFAGWLAANWHVWREFARQADRVWMAGRAHYSARTIGEFLRHYSSLREKPEGSWKLNDHVWPDLARLYIAMRPERVGFFELRSRGGERELGEMEAAA
jgi:hypothetical protein